MNLVLNRETKAFIYHSKAQSFIVYSLDLEKVARKIAVGFIFFLIGSFALTFIDGFV